MSLIVSNLRKKYGDRVVVDSLSFEMPRPGVYALLYTNGVGNKTSILKLFGIHARDGDVLL